MPALLVLVLSACRSALPLPDDALVPPDTLLLREWIPLGTERSMGRRERFDDKGCWWRADNTLLWVHDPVLQQARDPWLYLNGSWEREPWFCLGASDRYRLEQALPSLPEGSGVDELPAGTAIAVRTTAWVDGQRRAFTVPLGSEATTRETTVLHHLLGQLAAEGAWGGSPETGGDGHASTD